MGRPLAEADAGALVVGDTDGGADANGASDVDSSVVGVRDVGAYEDGAAVGELLGSVGAKLVIGDAVGDWVGCT